MEDFAHLPGELVGDFDTDIRLIGCEGCAESVLLMFHEPITTGAQEKPDLVEGIACTSAVAQCVLLDAAVHLTWGVASEHDDVESVEDTGCVLGAR